MKINSNKYMNNFNINNKLISLKIKNLILGYIIKKGKKKKAIGLLNKSLNLIFNHYCFNPLQLLKIVIYQHFSIIKKKDIISKKSNRIIKRIYYQISFEMRLKKAIQSIMLHKKINKKKYLFYIYLVQLLILQLPNKNKNKNFKYKKYKKYKKKSKKYIIFNLFKLINFKLKKKIKNKKIYTIRKKKIINKIKNSKSKKNKQYL